MNLTEKEFKDIINPYVNNWGEYLRYESEHFPKLEVKIKNHIINPKYVRKALENAVVEINSKIYPNEKEKIERSVKEYILSINLENKTAILEDSD